jgi:hypothetical protein
MKISIPQPCQENWNQMSPQEKGRFCSVCEKCVVDLSLFPDQKKIELIKTNPNICVKSNLEELERLNQLEIQNSRFRFPKSFRYSSFFLLLGFSSTAYSQVEIATKETISENQGKAILQANDSIRIIKGRVLDSEGVPIYQAMINLPRNRHLRVLTDTMGYFTLKIPNQIESNFVTIDSDYGYLDYELQNNSENIIVIQKIEIIKHSMVIGQTFVEKSFWNRTKHTFSWPFRKIGKLFDSN